MIVSGEAPRAVKLLQVMGGIAQVVGDSAAGSFKEAEHPRDNSGKFATSAGGGSTSASSAPAPMTNHLKKIVGAAGFKKAKGAGPTTYVHPSGVKIIVHPTPGKVHSSKWTVEAPSTKLPEDPYGGAETFSTKGEGTSLSKLLAKLVPKTEAPKVHPAAVKTSDPGWQAEAPVTSPLSPTEVLLLAQQQKLSELQKQGQPKSNPDPEVWTATAEQVGYEYVDSFDHQLEFMGAETKLTINTQTGEWDAVNVDTDKVEFSGSGMESFKEAFKANLGGIAPVKSQWANPQAELNDVKTSGSGKAITALGYEPVETEAGTTIYTKPNGAKIKYNSATTEWVAVTPGHMTKEGEGLPSLEWLLGGHGIPSGVKNSSQTIQTKAEAANQTEAQKKAGEAQAAQASKTASYSKLMKQLSDAAPAPNATEQAAVASYSGSNYTAINTALRHSPKNAAVDPKVKAIDSYLAKSTIPVDCTLYRKVSGEYAKILKSTMMEGCSFIDRGFISTSTHPETWEGNLKMVISVPAGSKGAAIKSISHHKSENEVLLPRNSRLIVTSLDFETGVVEVTLDQGHLK